MQHFLKGRFMTFNHEKYSINSCNDFEYFHTDKLPGDMQPNKIP